MRSLKISAFALLTLSLILGAWRLSAAVGGTVSGTSLPGISSKVLYANSGANLFQLKQLASAGTTIVVGPGMYTNGTNLLKNGVNWFFYPGSIISNVAPSSGAAPGPWDDRWSGAVTSIVSGSGKFVFNIDDNFNTSIGGIVVLTNPGTVLSLQCDTMEMSANNWNENSGASFCRIRNCASFWIQANEFNCVQFDLGIAPAGADGFWWERGQVYAQVKHIKTPGYGIWCLNPTDNLGATNDAYFECERIETFGASALYFSMSNVTHRAWLRLGEAISTFSPFGVCSLYNGGKVYITAEKLSTITCNLGGITMNFEGPTMLGCEAWLTVQKVSSDNAWLRNARGNLYADIAHFEDTGAVDHGIQLSGGFTVLRNATVRVNNGHAVVHTGGTNRLFGCTIDTSLTSSGTGATNNRPVNLSADHLTIDHCVLVGPPQTYPVFCTNANNIRYTSAFARTNQSPLLTTILGALTVDVDVE